MRIIEQVIQVCQDLAGKGWSDFLQHHWGFKIDLKHPDDLAKVLRQSHKSKLTANGFEDFAGGSEAKAIEPGSPSRSILYHALASPGVVPFDDEECYPTVEQLDIIENYVFSSLLPSIADLRLRFPGSPLGLVPFALEYRQAFETTHRKHADLVFSRTAIMRIGNQPKLYSKKLRSYVTFSDSDLNQDDVHVLPSRFAPFVAVQLKGSQTSFRPFRFRTAPDTDDGDNPDQLPDDKLNFWIPVHKLFSGTECLKGLDLDEVELTFHAENTKLRRFHQAIAVLGHPSGHHEPEISRPPFLVCEELVSKSSCGVLEPQAKQLVAFVHDENDRAVTFYVPEALDNQGSSLQIFPRPQFWAPEFVHVRFKRQQSDFEDLNSAPNIDYIVAHGKYWAAHLRDHSGEGFVRINCPQLLTLVHPQASAYFVLAQPDPLPLVKQSDLMEWWEGLAPAVVQKNLWYNAPRPLCDDRFPANVHLPNSDFRVEDRTVSAVVGFADFNNIPFRPGAGQIRGRTTALPDDASGIFAPGWDVGIDRTVEQTTSKGDEVKPFTHLAAYGLGSPFAEDSKLCAAQSAYWPAAAPDTARNYEPLGSPTVTPLTDEEMAWHPVEQPVLICWPTKSRPGSIRYPTRSYADYARSLLSEADLLAIRTGPKRIGRFNPRKLANITLEEYTTRTVTMARIYLAIGALSDVSSADDAQKTNLLAPGKDARSGWVVFSFRHYERSLLTQHRANPPADFRGYYSQLYKPVGQRPGLYRQFDSTIVYFLEMIEVVANPHKVLVYDQSIHTWKATERRKTRL